MIAAAETAFPASPLEPARSFGRAAVGFLASTLLTSLVMVVLSAV